MIKQNFRPRPALSPVLPTESAEERNRLYNDLKSETKPQGIIGQLMVADTIELLWDMQRYRRAKANIIKSAFRDALARLLRQLDVDDEKEWADQWFLYDDNRKKILKVLAQYKLDEHAIEAEAMRIRSRDLELFDRLIAVAEARFYKAVRSLNEYRWGLGRQLATGDRVIEGKVLTLDNAAKDPAPAGA